MWWWQLRVFTGHFPVGVAWFLDPAGHALSIKRSESWPVYCRKGPHSIGCTISPFQYHRLALLQYVNAEYEQYISCQSDSVSQYSFRTDDLVHVVSQTMHSIQRQWSVHLYHWNRGPETWHRQKRLEGIWIAFRSSSQRPQHLPTF